MGSICKVMKNIPHCLPMGYGRMIEKVTCNINYIGNVNVSESKVLKNAYNVAVEERIC